jgi:predicted nucleotide-binding protein
MLQCNRKLKCKYFSNPTSLSIKYINVMERPVSQITFSIVVVLPDDDPYRRPKRVTYTNK